MSEPVTLWHTYCDGDHFMMPDDGVKNHPFDEWRALPAAEFATLTRDLASARTALAEARKALGNAIGTFRYGKEMCQTTRDGHEAVGDAKAEEWDDSVSVFSFAIKDTRDVLARIDALAGEGG